MRLNHKMLAVTAILAAGILAGCNGSASSTSSASTASSVADSVPASSVVSSETAEETDALLPIDWGTLDDLKTESYKFAAKITSIKDGQMSMIVYGYDAYEKADIEALKAGDVIRTHDQLTNELKDITVETIETDEERGYVAINGGLEEGGMDLCVDHDVYSTMDVDVYPVYYKVGELTLPMLDDVSASDTSADPQADAVISEGIEEVEAAFNADPDGWTCYNTTVFTEDGKVNGILRIWVP